MSSGSRTHQKRKESAFQLLCLNHSFLSYISALVAHRDKLSDDVLLALLDDTVCYVEDVLQTEVVSSPDVEKMQNALTQRISEMAANQETRALLVLQQLGLLVALLPEITRQRRTLGRPNRRSA
nr:porin OmpA [Candidatus Pantoea persica]